MAALALSVIAHLTNKQPKEAKLKEQERKLKNYIDYNMRTYKERWHQAQRIEEKAKLQKLRDQPYIRMRSTLTLASGIDEQKRLV